MMVDNKINLEGELRSHLLSFKAFSIFLHSYLYTSIYHLLPSCTGGGGDV